MTDNKPTEPGPDWDDALKGLIDRVRRAAVPADPSSPADRPDPADPSDPAVPADPSAWSDPAG
ncbi:MAG: hypothetical protein LBJ44_09770, partial [Propionibacteriaceae bacterium]|nr:hypothetical protein [Propionibacteriaceae bacterium]